MRPTAKNQEVPPRARNLAAGAWLAENDEKNTDRIASYLKPDPKPIYLPFTKDTLRELPFKRQDSDYVLKTCELLRRTATLFAQK